VLKEIVISSGNIYLVQAPSMYMSHGGRGFGGRGQRGRVTGDKR